METAEDKVKWDDSNMRTSYADICNISCTREEIKLLFGISRARQAEQKEQTVRVVDHITLSPFVAKRLAILLNKFIQDYDSKSVPLEVTSPLTTRPENLSLEKFPFPTAEITDEKARLLIQLIENLNLEFNFERSFKIAKNRLLGNRFLLGISKKKIKQETLSDICVRMNMPDKFMETFQDNLPEATYIHFGFEENEETCLYKSYLEFHGKWKNVIKNQPDRTTPFLLYLGFKWDVSDNSKHALSKYTCYPLISVEDIIERLSNIFYGHNDRNPLEIAKAIVNLASKRISHEKLIYLEVREENNPRRSFDINLYQANFQLKELYPILSKTKHHYSIPAEEFDSLYEPLKEKVFGHLSGGIGRDGKDFLTVYYGKDAPLQNRLKQSTPCRLPAFKSKKTDEKAGLLLQLVKNLNVKYGFERSFKILEKKILANRFLLGFTRNTIKDNPHKKILNICKQMDMPENFTETFQENLSEANIVLFGFEEEEKTCMIKAYLEFGGRFKKVFEANPAQPGSFIIHLGFKWDASDNSRQATAKYTCYPSFTVQDMLERLSNVIYNHKQRKPFEIVEGILNMAAPRIGPGEFLYFEAIEENNPRISYDINMYRANLTMKEVYLSLLEMCRYHSISDEEFHNLYEPVKTKKFGHLTGGIDREGRDFFTVYFGDKGSSR